jgi:hypothetical protein
MQKFPKVKMPFLGLTGIEPITFRYERNILPLNYRLGEIFFYKNKMDKKLLCKKDFFSTSKLVVTNFYFLPI